ncbi:MAG: hypothetical protein HN909_02110 [Phycisphaerales bacterium]|nr:hypothetical protein [Phycisphaerales bacterium]MBT7170544.1 hypothetical protein [Phycisphaerales bacterium]
MRKMTFAVLAGLILGAALPFAAQAKDRLPSRGPMVRPMPGGRAPKPAKPSPTASMFRAFNAAKTILVADIQSVKWGPVMESYPMQYTLKITVKPGEALRGKLPAGKTLVLDHVIVGMSKPAEPTGKVVIALDKRGKRIAAMYPHSDTTVALARLAKGARDDLFSAFNQAEMLVVVKALDVNWSQMVGMSNPPMRNAKVGGKVSEVLRGKATKGKTISGSYTERTHQKTKFPAGAYVLALAESRGRVSVKKIAKADEMTLALARAAASVPVGWSPNDGAVLLCGKGITMAVEKVPPAKAIKWTNPDGDGEYKITVTNTNKQPVKVPALLNDGTKILWPESLKVVCQDKPQKAPGAKALPAKTQPTTLKAGESVSFVVNALGLKDVTWPRGGYRIEFRFCLGENSATKSFYYMSRHHDALRATAVKQFGGKKSKK